eukprot:3637450-Rhodomonas_salina.1
MPVAQVVFAVSKHGLVRREDSDSDMSLQELLLDKPPIWTTKPSRQYSLFSTCVHYELQHCANWHAAALHTAKQWLFVNSGASLQNFFSHLELPDLQGALLADAHVYNRELHALCSKAFENCVSRDKQGTLRLLGEAHVMHLQSKLLQLSVMLVPGSGTVLTNHMQYSLYASMVVQNNALHVESVGPKLQDWENMSRSVGTHSLTVVFPPLLVLGNTWKQKSQSGMPKKMG